MSISRITTLTIIGIPPESPHLARDERPIQAEIVVLDRSFSAPYPLLYQLLLQLESLSPAITAGLSLQRYGQLIYGEIRSLDRQKKEIVFSDMGTIQYRHLITICSEGIDIQKRDAELTAGLLALRDSLRLKGHLSQAWATTTFNETLPPCRYHPSRSSSLVEFMATRTHPITLHSAALSRCLYEIQT